MKRKKKIQPQSRGKERTKTKINEIGNKCTVEKNPKSQKLAI
jgi:hypothetical protein